jgi:hypothetical protein
LIFVREERLHILDERAGTVVTYCRRSLACLQLRQSLQARQSDTFHINRLWLRAVRVGCPTARISEPSDDGSATRCVVLQGCYRISPLMSVVQ